MIFPILKIINTELFIARKQWLYIYKKEMKKRIDKISDLLEEGRTEMGGK